MDHQELKNFFESIKGIRLVYNSQAPHSGAHNFSFYATPEALQDICVRAKRANAFLSVHFENEAFIYYIHITNDKSAEWFLTEEANGDRVWSESVS